ncbi:MAG: hypothetical protein J7L66_06395, partial [Anaerolineaceae bacterium]|nr:hypothetical protein [Anaerolineaceae bacterium]
INGIFVICFFIAGGFIPLREILLPKMYTSYDREQVCKQIAEFVDNSEYSRYSDEISSFCASEGTRVFNGYGFYPRFFDEGEGYYERSYDPFFGNQDYARLVFRVIGQLNGTIYIKTDNAGVRFKDGELVYALVPEKRKAGARLVIIASEEPTILIASPILLGEETFTGEQ